MSELDQRILTPPYTEEVWLHPRTLKESGVTYGPRRWRVKEKTPSQVTISELHPWGKPDGNAIHHSPEILHSLTIEEFQKLKKVIYEQHHQTQVDHWNGLIWVDTQCLPILELFWDHDIATLNCCQGDAFTEQSKWEHGYISFTEAGAIRIRSLLEISFNPHKEVWLNFNDQDRISLSRIGGQATNFTFRFKNSDLPRIYHWFKTELGET